MNLVPLKANMKIDNDHKVIRLFFLTITLFTEHIAFIRSLIGNEKQEAI